MTGDAEMKTDKPVPLTRELFQSMVKRYRDQDRQRHPIAKGIVLNGKPFVVLARNARA
jgi:hypothetical protein